jgi:hyperosmotically inducible protein
MLKVAALAIALALCASAAGAQDRRDRITEEIADALARYPSLTIFDAVETTVAQGQVVLSGWVTMAYKRDEIERRVRAVSGVASVDNRLQVLPVSQADDELRFRIARAIYGHAAFWSYAAMPNPPIHIIVNGGRVTLCGVVQSDVERQLAQSLAAGAGSRDVRNELKTAAQAQAERDQRSH